MSPCKSQDVVFVAASILAAIIHVISDQCEGINTFIVAYVDLSAFGR